ncbi:MAG: preprotein translocase subunit SecE [Clostridia bacterium]|nr:preprotein translocase subunit SecE [Clostridia bacterium]
MAAEAAPQTEKQVEKQPAKVEKKDKNQKAKAQKQPNPKQNKVKETVAELKKVTWPTFPKVVKNTLLVLVIVLISTAVLFGIDYVLSLLYKLLTPAA